MGILSHIGDTPLVRLERIGRGLPASVWVKCEHMNPGGSVKDRIALAIVDDAEQRGVLRPGMTLVEATAGNTGVGLALVAAARGYGLVCVMPEKMSADKRASLHAMGARVVSRVRFGKSERRASLPGGDRLGADAARAPLGPLTSPWATDNVC